MIELKQPKLKTFKPNGSNIQGCHTIKKVDEADYQELRQYLYYHHTSIGEYLVNCYRELDKPSFSNE
tara:strand:- start:195 stop:395 length:201 start_codon:yes stop_codon:yes gene_type:complete